MKKIDEKELKIIFTKLKSSNNQDAFSNLYSSYKNLVYKISFSVLKNREDSEEVVQEVFTKIYDMPKDKLPTEKVASWLYTVTRNQAITLLRGKKSTFNLDEIYNIEDDDNEINNIIDQIEFNRLISKLDDKEKEIVSLKILTNLKFEEIASLLNEPTGTVKWRYYKAQNSLKMLLSSLGMFIITFVIGLKSVLLRNNVSVPEQEISENSTEIKGIEDNEKNKQESLKKEDILQEEIDNINSNEELTNQIIVIPDNEEKDDIDKINIGFLSISLVFFIITIIFLNSFIKYQLKSKPKTSK